MIYTFPFDLLSRFCLCIFVYSQADVSYDYFRLHFYRFGVRSFKDGETCIIYLKSPRNTLQHVCGHDQKVSLKCPELNAPI